MGVHPGVIHRPERHQATGSLLHDKGVLVKDIMRRPARMLANYLAL